MADFYAAYEKTLLAEGGYKLHKVSGDTGGLTYAGIARKHNPDWHGWAFIDRGDTPPTLIVREFYKRNYWDPIQGDSIASQDIAESIYDFGVNTGIKVAAKLAQIVAGVTPDGTLGPKSLEALNQMDGAQFKQAYALAKIARYAAIVNKNRSQSKFLLGWINRTLKGLA